MPSDWQAIRLSLTLAALSTTLLLVLGTPLAWWLARTRWRWRNWIATLVTLPLVLPPTVLGFYLLLLLGPQGPLGRLTDALGLGTLPFTFPGLVVASMLSSMPLVVQPIRSAFESIGARPLEVAACLRASPLAAFFTVALPLARRGLLTGALLGFAHTLGEFGVVLMIGGNIPGETRVLSVAIYEHVETLQWSRAHLLAGGMLLFSFLAVLLLYGLEHRRPGHGQ